MTDQTPDAGPAFNPYILFGEGLSVYKFVAGGIILSAFEFRICFEFRISSFEFQMLQDFKFDKYDRIIYSSYTLKYVEI
jgi:hypothetical protein